MQLSATFDEQILKTLSDDQWFDFCTGHHIQSLEYSPEPSVLTFEDYKRLLNKQQSLDINTTFHVPYFAKKFNNKARAYDLSYFKTSPLDFKDQYDILLEYIYLYGEKTLLTFHGAGRLETYGTQAYDISRDTTWFAIDYLLGQLTKRGLPLTLCAELSGPKSKTYLTTREEILETIEKFKYSPIKICWDMTHDFSQNMSIDMPSQTFIDAVEHVHIHGINQTAVKHISLENSLLDTEKILTLLKNIGYEKTLVLELLIHTIGHPQDYLKTLSNNLDQLSKAL